MQPIRRILVAVKDTRRGSSAAILKAAALARACGARLELFHALSETVAFEMLAALDQSVKTFGEAERARHLKRLEAIAARLRRAGIEVATAAEWDYPVHEALVRHAQRTRADLIVAEQHVRGHVAPWLLRYADWELLRHSPVPVLLVKNTRRYRNPKVLAAVDPAHAFEKTARLDREILRFGAAIGTAMRGQLHVVHAYVPDIIGMRPADLSGPDATRRIIERAKIAAAAGLDRTLRAARIGTIAASRRHLLAQHPINAIPELAHELGCDIVVMGALSRSGLKRLIVGNTAERLLDELTCDLLIVKPPAFDARVGARVRGPQLVTLTMT